MPKTQWLSSRLIRSADDRIWRKADIDAASSARYVPDDCVDQPFSVSMANHGGTLFANPLSSVWSQNEVARP
jgi:hypothetical protein